MRLDMAIIENFRSIKNATVKFNEITALVGENNAGKTAILRALNSVFNYSFERNSSRIQPTGLCRELSQRLP